MNLALFDLDNTLLSGDTDVEWLDFLIEAGRLDAPLRGENLEMDRRYRSGEAGALEYVRFYLRFYARFTIAELIEHRDVFLRKRIEPRILPAARRLLQSHRLTKAGSTVTPSTTCRCSNALRIRSRSIPMRYSRGLRASAAGA
jgi:phosphoserine phosphatase